MDQDESGYPVDLTEDTHHYVKPHHDDIEDQEKTRVFEILFAVIDCKSHRHESFDARSCGDISAATLWDEFATLLKMLLLVKKILR